MKILALWLDALSPKKITRKNTPFLYSLAQKNQLGIHQPVFGFSSIGAAFYTGKGPVETNQLCFFWKERNWFNRFLSCCPQIPANVLFNLKRAATRKTLLRIPDRKILRNFDFAQTYYYHHPQSLPHPTLLNIFDAKGITYLDYSWPYLVRNNQLRYEIFTKPHDQEITTRFLKLAQRRPYQVFLLHLYDNLDATGHQFGPNSAEYTRRLQLTDSLAQKIVESLIGPKDKFLIWSDHGMLEVRETFDLEKILPETNHYLYFLDSTLARFWFKTDKIKKEVLKILLSITIGHLLSSEEKAKLGIDFTHTKYGEEIFLVNPGTLICPNAFQKKPVRGMHGYNRKLSAERGFFISSFLSSKTATTPDLHQAILAQLT